MNHSGILPSMVEPEEWHEDTARVEMGAWHSHKRLSVPLLCISGGYTVGYVVEEHPVYLDPQQALSLLAWLEEARGMLERLAKENQAK
jgi:hypothetical protein